MKYEFIIKHNSSSLAILFAGWGMDSNPFKDYSLNCDFVVLYDYNDFDFDTSILAQYSNIYIFAWSFGVYGATKFIVNNPNLPVCFKMAINGTMNPIDNELGIPNDLFEGTYNGLSDISLIKFYRRICFNKEHYDNFALTMPKRELMSLKKELLTIRQNCETDNNFNLIWNKAIISYNDKIFPPQNQERAWQRNAHKIVVLNEAHFPRALSRLINENIINKPLLKRRFTKILDKYNNEAVFQHKISTKLHDIWQNLDYKKGASVLEIGCGTGFLTNLYINNLAPARLVINDLCEIPDNYIESNSNYTFIAGDAEKLTFTGGGLFDYIVSASAIQWFENLPNFILKASSMLNDKGLIVFSTFGKKNMQEIEHITGKSLHYYNKTELVELFNKKFEILHIEEDCDKLMFNSPIEVIKHIKLTGVNSFTNNKTWTKADLEEFSNNYSKENGNYPLTYNPIYIIARKK